ncbi:T9SS-dependent choice-of-anchor J family protein [Cochleicola gelatinilyticus]|uniref:Uncharacterized protein n=1 Tax=Cochleicola gelatinilyticus TaxID=1763537 RepID=A0A167ERF8_9FLAO|nr:T9SS type A sorting domain-containing protein [Cochleicola gelatinilyticus]OAB75807.1 hypothetical protein ULVI_15130 [Cochleicola gelatinilyticus]
MKKITLLYTTLFLVAFSQLQAQCDVIIPNYIETFNAGIVPPDCWSEATAGTPETGPMELGGGLWAEDDYLNDTVASGDMDNSARINLFFNTTADWLISPAFDLSGSDYELVYNVAVTGFGNSNPSNMGSDDEVQVLISEDDGVTWNALTTYNTSNTPSNAGQEERIDLSEYTGNAIFAFWASEGTTNDPEDYDFFIDEFQVREPLNCTPPTFDLVVTEGCIGEDGEFNVAVNINTLGSAPAIVITDDQGSVPQTVTEIGSFGFGPYVSGTIITYTLTGDDPDCTQVRSVSFICIPENDNCITPTGLVVGEDFNTNPITATNQSATDSMEADPTNCDVAGGNGNYMGGDVWFSVTVPADGIVTIETNSVDGSSLSDSAMAVYSGECGTLTQIECDDDDSDDGNFSLISINDTSLANTTLLVRVWEFGNNAFGEFLVSAYNPNILNVADIDNASVFSMYPNPTENLLHIKGVSGKSEIRIVNMIGQVVYSKNTTQNFVDVSTLPSGIYNLQINNNEASQTLRFVKN